MFRIVVMLVSLVVNIASMHSAIAVETAKAAVVERTVTETPSRPASEPVRAEQVQQSKAPVGAGWG